MYTIGDHLGSLRALVNDTGTVIRSVDYEPFGDVYAENGLATRREFLNLERDRESALGDHGVRKYDAELGRFISVDPLWEAFPAFSPYQYGANSPLRVVDVDGKDVIILNDNDAAGGSGHNAVLVGNDETGWVYYSKDGADDDGMQQYDKASFGTFQEFIESQRASRYQHGARIATTTDQDKIALEFAGRDYRSEYDAATNNCGDLVNNTLRSIGKGIPGVKQFGITIPNAQFSRAVLNGTASDVLHFDHAATAHQSGRPYMLDAHQLAVTARRARHTRVDRPGSALEEAFRGGLRGILRGGSRQ